MQDVIDRLETARRAIGERRGAIEGGEPWPLSVAYGTEPESDWGPKEVLAHVAEMLTYWPEQIEAILATAPAKDPVPFGRTAADANRIGRIGRDRSLAAGELFDGIDAAAAAFAERAAAYDDGQLGRRGLHVRLGAMTIPAIVERFIVGHLEEHVTQLDEIVAKGAG
jgi:hypothetical protein